MANTPNSQINDCAVKIAVRERPARDYPGLDIDEPSVVNYHERSSNILVVDERPFTFDYVLGPKTTQQQIFVELIKPLVSKVKQGYNCTVLAYGQTGTGKSYTMGLNNFEDHHVGIIPRCLHEIHSLSICPNNDCAEDTVTEQLQVSASFIEIYNEKVFDLLSENSTEPIVARGYKFTGGIRKKLETMEDCHNILVQGNKNRHVRPTKLNSQSSRSHAIFTIHVRTISSHGVTSASLNLVDLAGSEGVRRTGHQGMAMSEGVHINQGLLSINKVLQAKAMGRKVIPYRDSVLSLVLQDSFNANSYLTLLACISPHRADLSETLSTLRFAQRSKQLKHTPLINSILAELKKKAKTPKTRDSTPLKRSYIQAGLNPLDKVNKLPFHSNTFCTPSKMKCLNVSEKLNRTEIGLIPKEKEKTQMGTIRPITKKSIVGAGPGIMTTNPTTSNINRESLFDNTIDSRVSLMSMNMSSSTAVDGNFGRKAISFSPIVRKCMSQIENVVDNKMSQLVETLKDINKENYNKHPVLIESTPFATPWPASGAPFSSTLRKELKSIIKEVLIDKSSKSEIPINHNENDTALILLSNETPPTKENAKCQLFTSSPIALEDNTIANNTKKITSDMPIDVSVTAYQENHDNTNEETLYKNTILRRSRRITMLQENKSNTFFDGSVTANKTLRRSLRLSGLMQRQVIEGAEITNISMKASVDSAEHSKPRRRSSRKSLLQIHKERRRSIRLAAHREEPEPDLEPDTEMRMEQKSKTNKKSRTGAFDNSVLAAYFSDKPTRESIVGVKPKTSLTKHRKAILHLLNTGSMKELQYLPQIGQKTAFQLLTQRTLNGKFKNIKQIEKLPIWRGNSWERFAQANMLID